MQSLMDSFFPPIDLIWQLSLPFLALSLLAAGLAGWLRVRRRWNTPYTRKVFHFVIFSAAALVHYRYGLPAVSLFGCVVAGLVVIAVLLGNRVWFYSALARATDEPHASRFILIPLVATAAGGILSNLLFPSTAFIGYLVGGWGDAVGEPVGTRWGRHRYTVPTLFGVRATRSLEGSMAVMAASTVVSYLSLLLLFGNSWLFLAYACICGVVAAAVEAVSSHGLDNLTIQVASAGALYFLL